MTNETPKREKTMTLYSDSALIVLIVILVILFAGEPDLHDALVKSLMPTLDCKAVKP